MVRLDEKVKDAIAFYPDMIWIAFLQGLILFIFLAVITSDIGFAMLMIILATLIFIGAVMKLNKFLSNWLISALISFTITLFGLHAFFQIFSALPKKDVENKTLLQVLVSILSNPALTITLGIVSVSIEILIILLALVQTMHKKREKIMLTIFTLSYVIGMLIALLRQYYNI